MLLKARKRSACGGIIRNEYTSSAELRELAFRQKNDGLSVIFLMVFFMVGVERFGLLTPRYEVIKIKN